MKCLKCKKGESFRGVYCRECGHKSTKRMMERSYPSRDATIVFWAYFLLIVVFIIIAYFISG